MRKRAFGELELEVLNLVRDKKRATVRDIYEEMGEESRYTTIMTVMNRLFEKGDLDRERKGRQYVYWISENRSSSVFSLLGRLKTQLFQGNPSDLIHYLIESSPNLSDDQLDELGNFIEKEKKKREEE